MEERATNSNKEGNGGSAALRFLPFTDATTGSIDWPQKRVNQIKIMSNSVWHYLKPKHIVLIKASGRYEHIYTFDKHTDTEPKRWVVRYTLKHFEQWLFPYGFIQVNRGEIINMARLERQNGNMLFMGCAFEGDILLGSTHKELFEFAVDIYHKP